MEYLTYMFFFIIVKCGLPAKTDAKKMRLSDIAVLTLYNAKMTNARRSSPIPQVKCVGGSAGCFSFTPQVVQCYNRGSDGYDVQWECKTDMNNAYRFGRVEVSCEGYEYPDDPYILRGSCGLEYTLDLTESGHKTRGQHSHSNNKHYGSSSNSFSGYFKTLSKGTSMLGDIIMLFIVGLIIYAIYKTCIGNNAHDYRYDHSTLGSDDTYPSGGGFGPSAPPPDYGFRSEYMPGTGGCQGRYTPRRNNDQSSFGGFWTGAAMGGLAGYLFGNNSTGRTQRHGSSWQSSSWGSDSFSSSDSGSRSASGFGGTSRR